MNETEQNKEQVAEKKQEKKESRFPRLGTVIKLLGLTAILVAVTKGSEGLHKEVSGNGMIEPTNPELKNPFPIAEGAKFQTGSETGSRRPTIKHFGKLRRDDGSVHDINNHAQKKDTGKNHGR